MNKSQNEVNKVKDLNPVHNDDENILEMICDLQRELYEYL